MSIGGSVAVGDMTPVDDALDGLITSFDHLMKLLDDGGLESYQDMAFIGFMQTFERLRNRLSLVDHRVIADGDRRGLPDLVCQSTMFKVLTSVLSVSRAEAARRVRAAEAVGARTTMLGEELAPPREYLAAAQHTGEVSAEKVAIVQSALAKVDRPGFDPGEIIAGERLLTEHATVFGPEDLRLLAARVVDAIDPDGTLPDDELNHDRRQFTSARPKTVPTPESSGSPGRPGRSSALCSTDSCRPRWRHQPARSTRLTRLARLMWVMSTANARAATASPVAVLVSLIPVPVGSGCMTPSKTCATGS